MPILCAACYPWQLREISPWIAFPAGSARPDVWIATARSDRLFIELPTADITFCWRCVRLVYWPVLSCQLNPMLFLYSERGWTRGCLGVGKARLSTVRMPLLHLVEMPMKPAFVGQSRHGLALR